MQHSLRENPADMAVQHSQNNTPPKRPYIKSKKVNVANTSNRVVNAASTVNKAGTPILATAPATRLKYPAQAA